MPDLIEPPGRDQGVFWVVAEGMLNGEKPYQDIWDHKPPCVYFVYMVAQVFFHDFIGITIMEIIIVLLNGILLYKLSGVLLRLIYPAEDFEKRPIKKHFFSLFALFLYLIFFNRLPFGGYWNRLQAEILIDFFMLCSLLLILRRTRRVEKGHWIYFNEFLAGLCISLALTAKTTAVLLVPVCMAAAAIHGKTNKLKSLFWFCFGCAFLWMLFFPLLYFAGILSEFVEATIIFNLYHSSAGSISMGTLPLWPRILFAFPYLFPLYILSLLGIIGLVAGRRSVDIRYAAIPLLWWIAVLCSVFVQRKFWLYHYQNIVLPLAIMASLGQNWIMQLTRRPYSSFLKYLFCALFAASLVPYTAFHSRYYKSQGYWDYYKGELSRKIFYSRFRWGLNDFNYYADVLVADYIKKEVQDSEKIFIWGYEPLVYALSDRRPASRFIFDYPLSVIEWNKTKRRRICIEELKKNKPELFLVLKRDRNDLELFTSEVQLRNFPELYDYLESDYKRITAIEDFAVYHRKTD